jgi:hypothetical protein
MLLDRYIGVAAQIGVAVQIGVDVPTPLFYYSTSLPAVSWLADGHHSAKELPILHGQLLEVAQTRRVGRQTVRPAV